ncbi:glycosyltransferase family 2 protein, partial [Candidatus Woesearchaeota archaeon]|nr:glycosyltransferase family 2 protein [Candidatus Woesearchaeota archaeon]
MTGPKYQIKRTTMKVSLYIPTCNSGQYIRKCLDSVFGQETKFSEVIIIDEDSTDDTSKIASGYPVRIVKTEKESGLAHARNIGLKQSKHELVASIDSDVVLDKNWLKNMLAFSEDKTISGVGGKLVENQKDFCSRWRRAHMKQDWGDKQVRNPRFLFGSNCIFRKKAIIDAGGYDDKYKTNYEDVDISRRLLDKGRCLIYNPKSVCYHRKKDKIWTLIKSYYNWTFYGYPTLDNFMRLLYRLFIVNPYKSLR